MKIRFYYYGIKECFRKGIDGIVLVFGFIKKALRMYFKWIKYFWKEYNKEETRNERD